jgi:hypothetical protein
MSEKIYACLLRLFPSAFRKHYEEEALQLLRDRLRDETGLFPRLRLILSLMADTARALPQAYRNSYAEAAPASSLVPRYEGAPSFRGLQTEPIRPATIAIAAALSLTALATFTFIMGRPTMYRPAARNRPMSPIESVIERLNQTISPESGDSVDPDAAEPSSANTGRSETRPLRKTNAPPAPRPGSEASEASQPFQPSQQYPNMSNSDSAPSPAVAMPSSATQVQPHTIQGVTESVVPLNMQPSIHAGVAGNLSGRWAQSLWPRAQDAVMPQWFVLKQEGAKLTGTGTSNSTEQYPINHGLIAGDSVKFELPTREKTFFYELRLENKELRGTLSIKGTNKTRTTEVRLERVH